MLLSIGWVGSSSLTRLGKGVTSMTSKNLMRMVLSPPSCMIYTQFTYLVLWIIILLIALTSTFSLFHIDTWPCSMHMSQFKISLTMGICVDSNGVSIFMVSNVLVLSILLDSNICRDLNPTSTICMSSTGSKVVMFTLSSTTSQPNFDLIGVSVPRMFLLSFSPFFLMNEDLTFHLNWLFYFVFYLFQLYVYLVLFYALPCQPPIIFLTDLCSP